MYVCVCRAVTERQIHKAARDGAKSLRDLRKELGVTTDCGRCAGCARDCLRQAHSANQDHCEQPAGLIAVLAA